MNRAVKVLIEAVMAVAVVVMVGSCGLTNQIVKSGDPEAIYQRALKFYDEENWKKAATLFEASAPYYVGSLREDTVLFYGARSRFKNGEFESSSQQFDDFRRRFGRSVFVEDAEGMYTLSKYYQAPPVTRDQQLSHTAIMSINEFLSRYPDSAQAESFEEMRDELTKRIHDKEFLNAYAYFKIGKYKSAIIAFKNAMKKYPESMARERVSYYVVASAYELADNSVIVKKEDRFLSMLDSYISFIAEFPESEYRDDVDAMEKKARIYLAKCEEDREKAKSREGREDDEEDDDSVIGFGGIAPMGRE